MLCNGIARTTRMRRRYIDLARLDGILSGKGPSAMIATKVRPRQRASEPAERAERFDWPLANEAEALLRNRIQEFLARNSFARRLAERMRDETATDFFEWVDHLIIPTADEGLL